MARGGARNRSGPQADPKSGRSDRRGLAFGSLPSEGYRGKFPAFPLSDVSEREAVVWASAWRTPQAAQWVKEPWRHATVAMWVRWSVRMEDPESSASLGAVVQRLADQIGMTPAGLKENGWQIAADEVSVRRETAAPDAPSRPARRLRAVSGGGA